MPRRKASEAETEPDVDEAEFLETLGEKSEPIDAELETHLAKPDETAPGGAYVVNGILVDANGKAI